MKNKSVFVGKLVVIMLLLSSVFGLFWYGKPTNAKTKTITIEKGKTYKLKVKKGSKIKCSNAKVATVTQKGKIKAVKKGKCTIKVIKGKKVKKYNICVNDNKQNDADKAQTTDIPSGGYSDAIVHTFRKFRAPLTDRTYICFLLL